MSRAARALALAGLLARAGAALATGGATTPNPVATFTAPGLQTVTLTVCNTAGCSTTSRQVLVLPGGPELTSVSVAPVRLARGRLLFLSATGGGQPPLDFHWEILQTGAIVAELSGATVTWNTAGAAPGLATVRVTLASPQGATSIDREILVLAETTCMFVPLRPGCRVLDTRGGQPLVAGPPRVVAIGGRCGIPASACAVGTHLTAVGPTLTGALALTPGDEPLPLVETLPLTPGRVASSFAILPLSQDGAGTLAASLSGTTGRIDLVLDAEGYFAPTATAPVPLTFAARLCPFGFCETATGVPVFFTEAFSAPATSYRYDWTGSGVFDPPSAVPITQHVYATPGVFTPVVEVSSGGPPTQLRHFAPILVLPADPPAAPPAPAGVTARFGGLLATSTLDPTLAGPLWSYELGATPGAPNLLGYNAYVSRGNGPPRLVAALAPGLPPDPPLAVVPAPTGEPLTLRLTAVNVAGESPLSPPVVLPPP